MVPYENIVLLGEEASWNAVRQAMQNQATVLQDIQELSREAGNGPSGRSDRYASAKLVFVNTSGWTIQQLEDWARDSAPHIGQRPWVAWSQRPPDPELMRTAFRLGAHDFVWGEPPASDMLEAALNLEIEPAFNQLLPLRELERKYIHFVLHQTGGRKEKAAGILQIDRKTLYRKTHPGAVGSSEPTTH